MTPIYRFTHRTTALLLGHGQGSTPGEALADLCAAWGYPSPQDAGADLADLEAVEVTAQEAWDTERRTMAAVWCDRWESQPLFFCVDLAEAEELGAFEDEAAR